MENHHFSWENPLFLWPFSIAFCMFTRGYKNGDVTAGIKKWIFDPLSFLTWRNPRAIIERNGLQRLTTGGWGRFCCLNPSETEDEAMNIMNQKTGSVRDFRWFYVMQHALCRKIDMKPELQPEHDSSAQFYPSEIMVSLVIRPKIFGFMNKTWFETWFAYPLVN